jgi:hypothetical protein
MNISVRNFLMIGVMAMLFFIVTKVIVNKYPNIFGPIQDPVNMA